MRFLTLCLEQANETVLRFKADPTLFDAEEPGTYFVRLCEDSGTGKWKDGWHRPVPMKKMFLIAQKLDERRLGGLLSSAKRTGMTWEIDSFYSPATVGEKGRRPYFPVSLLFSDHDSYFILNACITEPRRYLVELHEQLLQAIEKAKVLPREILVRKKEVSICLGSLADRLDIQVRLVERLPAIEDARQGMSEFFRKS